jgi:hypothetical protein
VGRRVARAPPCVISVMALHRDYTGGASCVVMAEHGPWRSRPRAAADGKSRSPGWGHSALAEGFGRVVVSETEAPDINRIQLICS